MGFCIGLPASFTSMYLWLVSPVYDGHATELLNIYKLLRTFDEEKLYYDEEYLVATHYNLQ